MTRTARRRPLLRCRELEKDYGDAAAVGPISLTVRRGESVALVGHNGSGKSTLLSLVAGVIDPTGGRVDVDGQPAGSLEARAVVSHLPDNPVLYDDLSLREHLDYLLGLHGLAPADTDSGALLERFGLAHRVDDLPSSYSRGLRQKAALILGMCRPFGLLLIDEPFAGLDRRGRETLLELLDEITGRGASVIVATHDAGAVPTFGRVVELDDGRLVDDEGSSSTDPGGGSGDARASGRTRRDRTVDDELDEG